MIFPSVCSHDDFRSVAASWWKSADETFRKAAALFEAGVAELYDYSHLGHDPLKELVVGLDLETVPMTGRTVILDEKIITSSAASNSISEKGGGGGSKFIGVAPSFTRRTSIIWRTGRSTASIPGSIRCFPRYSTNQGPDRAKIYCSFVPQRHRDRTVSDVGAQRS